MALTLLTVTNSLTEAQVLRTRLAAAGIAAVIPDEAMATIDWGLVPALGGIRVLVAPGALEAARLVVGPRVPESGAGEGELPSAPEWGRSALRASVLSLLVPLVIPYAYYPLLRALRDGPSSGARWRVLAAASVLLASTACWGVILLKLSFPGLF